MSRPPPSPDFTLRGSDSAITCLTFKGDLLLSGTQRGTLCAWSLRSRRPVWTNEAHAELSVLKIEVLKNDRILSQGRDGFIHVWHLNATNQLEKTGSIQAHHLGFCAASVVELNSKESVILPTDNKSDIAVKVIESSETVCVLSPSGADSKAYGMVMSLRAFSKNDRWLLLAGYEDGRLVLWELSSQSELSSCNFFEESIMSLDFSLTVNRGVTTSVGVEIITFSLSEDFQLLKGKTVEVTNPGMQCAVFRDDAKVVVTGGWDGRLRLFSAKTMKPLAVLDAHTDSVQCVAFAQDNTLATGSKDKNISIWSIYK